MKAILAGILCLGLAAAIASAQLTFPQGTVQQLVHNDAGIGIGTPDAVISDAAGGFYFTTSNLVYRVISDGRVAWINTSGAATDSITLGTKLGIAVDGSGNLFIADADNHRIRKVSPLGVVTTVAGNGTPGFSGDGESAASAQLWSPRAVAVDGSGNLFIADTRNNRVRKVTSAGIITTVAGNGTSGFSGDGGAAASAALWYPLGVVVDGSGNLFIADTRNNRVRKVTAAGIIGTVAGDGTAGFGGDNGPAAAAQLDYPGGIAIDGVGTLFIADNKNNRARKVTPDGVVTTIAGNGSAGFSGDGGPAVSAQFDYPNSVAVDVAGNLFIADNNNHRVRKVTTAGIVATVAGDGNPVLAGELLQLAGASELVSSIGRSNATGIISTIAGGGLDTRDNVPAISTQLFYPTSSVAVDTVGNVLTLTTANDDIGSGLIRIINTAGIIKTVGTARKWYFFDYDLRAPAGEVCVAGIAADAAGNLFVAETISQAIWEITPTGTITRVAGSGSGTPGFGGDGGPATSAQLSFPNGVVLDRDGNLYIADSYNNRIRKVSPSGVITTVAGNGIAGYGGDGGSATSAQLRYPLGVAVDGNGNLLIADSHNHRIRKVTPIGIITTVAGDGTQNFGGDGGPATAAQLNYPTAIALNGEGIYIADYDNNRIRQVTPDGLIHTVAGNGEYGFSGDGGPAIAAGLLYPAGIAVDGSGNLFIADQGNNRIRKVSSTGLIATDITPSTGGRGDVVQVTLSGTNFDPTLSINPIDGITVSNLTTTSPTSATATFAIAPDAAHGTRSVTLSASGQTSNAVAFTVNPPPELASLNPPVGVPGVALKMTFTGSGFRNGMNVDAGSGITVSSISVTNSTSAVATFTITPNAVLGARSVKVTTSDGASSAVAFNVVLPFPDLAASSSHATTFGVGFTESYIIHVDNAGLTATTGGMTITDVLPAGLSFVSGGGSTWSCSASGQTVTCLSSGILGPGASIALQMDVAVSSDAASQLVHTPSVSTAGDVNPSNNSASDPTIIAATPVPVFVISPYPIDAVEQAGMRLVLPTPFPHDVSGSVTLSFLSATSIPGDDPAIQFASGGRQTTFTIPANTLAASVGGNAGGVPLGFQTGTVAGSVRFSGTLLAGTVQANFSTSSSFASGLFIPAQAPSIQSIETSTKNGFAVLIGLWSTTREISQFSLTFNTTTPVSLSCGSVSGCSASGSTMTFDVQSLFDDWFNSGLALGSLSTLRLPLSFSGVVHGSVDVRLKNRAGASAPQSFPLP